MVGSRNLLQVFEVVEPTVRLSIVVEIRVGFEDGVVAVVPGVVGLLPAPATLATRTQATAVLVEIQFVGLLVGVQQGAVNLKIKHRPLVEEEAAVAGLVVEDDAEAVGVETNANRCHISLSLPFLSGFFPPAPLPFVWLWW